ncbi:helix-turn-helix domain-containing protein [Actinomadura kijaniata]|uniref:helix-turn-helix domain-containing protein n=1 Tax=Actinomadura kijaniata TaxID=46161 RepID=UPI00082E59E0|nr:helix-turn-helix transcriptional regulator [Actinomadura kijaniata]
MAARRPRPTPQPALQAFGRQMRRYREQANLLQQAVASRTNTTTSFVSQVETGKKRCQRSFAATVDQLTGAGGALLDLYDDLNRDGSPVPLWFDWPEVEQEAVTLTTYQHSMIPGLLQTPEYAGASLRSEEKSAARMARQQILTRDSPAPTTLVALVDEQVLHRPVGSSEVMRAQLEHLIAMSERPNVTVQIVRSSGEHNGNGGAFVVATMEDRSEVAYMEMTIRAITTDSTDDLAALALTLIDLRSRALPADMSRDFVRRVIEDRWT